MRWNNFPSTARCVKYPSKAYPAITGSSNNKGADRSAAAASEWKNVLCLNNHRTSRHKASTDAK